MTFRVLLTSHFPAVALAELQKYSEIHVDYRDEHAAIPAAELLKRVQGVDGIMCHTADKLNQQVLSAAGDQLKVVSTMSVGYDHIDLSYCKQHGIQVDTTPGILADTTAELSIALMLSTSRRLREAQNAVVQGEWSSWKAEWLLGCDIGGSVVGIVGFGEIGKAVARKLTAFEPKRIIVSQPRRPSSEELDLGYGKKAEYVDWEEFLQTADIISVHCPLKKETDGLFNKEAFSLMKDTCVFINVSRGGTVDQDALLEKLQQSEDFYAGLDVCTPEPIPTDHPLLKQRNCTILPHIGSATRRTREQMALAAAQHLIEGLQKERA